MKHYFSIIKTYLATHKKGLFVGVIAVVCIAFLTALIMYNYNRQPTVVYKPVGACQLFTHAEAQELLGDKIIDLNSNKAILTGDVATSKCSYTDSNPDIDNMRVAAVAVRIGVNDKGVNQNKVEFASAKSNQGVKAVDVFEQEAFFNKAKGQLNILDGHSWIIISIGTGSEPENHSLDKAIKLADKVLS